MTTHAIQPSIILIVDDDPSTLLLSAKPLQDAGYAVIQAPGSSEALRICAEHPHPVDLVLADGGYIRLSARDCLFREGFQRGSRGAHKSPYRDQSRRTVRRVRIFEYHLRIQRKAADFLCAGEILDLLHSGHVRTLTPLFHVWGARGSAREEDVVAKVKEGLLSPEWTVLCGLCHRGREQTKAQQCRHNARDHTPACRTMLRGDTSAV